MSLRDAGKKMSKSDPSDQSRINLIDNADTIALKIRRAKTDPEPLPETIAELDGRPEAVNLIGIYAAITNTTPAAALAEFAGSGSQIEQVVGCAQHIRGELAAVDGDDLPVEVASRA